MIHPSSDRHVHDFLVGFHQAVAHLGQGLKGHLGLLPRNHDLLQRNPRLAPLIVVGEGLGGLLQVVDMADGLAQDLAKGRRGRWGCWQRLGPRRFRPRPEGFDLSLHGPHLGQQSLNVGALTHRCHLTPLHQRGHALDRPEPGCQFFGMPMTSTVTDAGCGPTCKLPAERAVRSRGQSRTMAGMCSGLSRFRRRPAKSNSSGSASWEGATLPMAAKMESTRPGWLRSHSWSMLLMTWRCRLSWEPHRLQGMMGKPRYSA